MTVFTLFTGFVSLNSVLLVIHALNSFYCDTLDAITIPTQGR